MWFYFIQLSYEPKMLPCVEYSYKCEWKFNVETMNVDHANCLVKVGIMWAQDSWSPPKSSWILLMSTLSIISSSDMHRFLRKDN